jgi:hypothetical protein
MLKAVFEEASKQQEKCINSTWFMGEMWKAGSVETDIMHKCIYKFLNNTDDLSMNYFGQFLTPLEKSLKELMRICLNASV